LAQHVSSAGRHDRLALRHDHVCRRHSWEVTLFGCGAHRSMPQKSINPVVMAASAVMHLQGVVSREVAMTDAAVVTVSTLRAGMTESVIPDQALLRQNVRTFKDQVRQRVLAAIRRIPEAEASASAAPKPPEFSVLSEYPVTSNDEPATRDIVNAFERWFGTDRVRRSSPLPQARTPEFSVQHSAYRALFGLSAASTRRFSGPRRRREPWTHLPGNQAPDFAPAIHPHTAHRRRGLAGGGRRMAGGPGSKGLTFGQLPRRDDSAARHQDGVLFPRLIAICRSSGRLKRSWSKTLQTPNDPQPEFIARLAIG
jgi:hypothetical protein